jgi:fumarate hydratase class I
VQDLHAIGATGGVVAVALGQDDPVAFLYEFDVKDMPVTVAVDSKGESVHITGPAIWQKKISESLAVEVQ